MVCLPVPPLPRKHGHYNKWALGPGLLQPLQMGDFRLQIFSPLSDHGEMGPKSEI